MIKRDELANPNSCINRADDDEPVFVLRAHDPAAPEIVREWADAYASRKEDKGSVMTETQRAKYREALNLAQLMEVWQAEHGIKSWA